jgi:hypothetical protein
MINQCCILTFEMRFLLSNLGVTLTNYYAATHPSQPNYVIKTCFHEQSLNHNIFLNRIFRT